jgi:hypothetical protein
MDAQMDRWTDGQNERPYMMRRLCSLWGQYPIFPSYQSLIEMVYRLSMTTNTTMSVVFFVLS